MYIEMDLIQYGFIAEAHGEVVDFSLFAIEVIPPFCLCKHAGKRVKGGQLAVPLTAEAAASAVTI